METLTALAISTVTFLIGLVGGNRLAIGRDRRKEFNTAIEPIRGMLIKERARPSPMSPSPDSTDIELISSMFGRRKAKRFYIG